MHANPKPDMPVPTMHVWAVGSRGNSWEDEIEVIRDLVGGRDCCRRVGRLERQLVPQAGVRARCIADGLGSSGAVVPLQGCAHKHNSAALVSHPVVQGICIAVGGGCAEGGTDVASSVNASSVLHDLMDKVTVSAKQGWWQTQSTILGCLYCMGCYGRSRLVMQGGAASHVKHAQQPAAQICRRHGRNTLTMTTPQLPSHSVSAVIGESKSTAAPSAPAAYPAYLCVSCMPTHICQRPARARPRLAHSQTTSGQQHAPS